MVFRSSWRSNPVVVRRFYFAVWLALLTLIWGTYAIDRGTITDTLARELNQRMNTDAQVLEDHATRTLDAVVTRMESVAALSGRSELQSGRIAPQQLKNLLFNDTMVRSLSLVDPAGRIVTSSNLAIVGKSVTPELATMLGPPSTRPRAGVRFGDSLAQRDLPDPPPPDGGGPSIWVAQLDAPAQDLAGYRWVAAINPGFFQNLWDTVAQPTAAQVGLFDYEGRSVVLRGTGPAQSSAVMDDLRQALQTGSSGVLRLPDWPAWQIHYRASSRHPLVFMMLVERDAHLRHELQRSSLLWWTAWGATALVTLVVSLLYASFLRYERSLRQNLLLLQAAQTDALTGLANRRGFETMAAQDMARAIAFGEPLSLLIMDLDHFKSINDRFGHAAGDAVLQVMANRWRALLRSHDLIARIGGEEFCLMLPGTGLQHAQAVARKLLDATRREPVAVPGSRQAVPITLSIGLVSVDRCTVDTRLDEL